MGSSGGAFATSISFDNDQEVEVEQASLSATLGYQLSTRLGITGSAGLIVGGTMTPSEGNAGGEGDVGRGFTGSLSLNYLPLFESESRPFVATSLTLGGSFASPESDDGERHGWRAFDARLGLMVGKTVFDHLVPFAAARAFGGPVSWTLGGEEVVGADIYHYTVGAGALYQVPGSFSLFAELLALGERSASLGGSLAF